MFKHTRIVLTSPIGMITVHHTDKGISNIDLDRTENENRVIKDHIIIEEHLSVKVVSYEGRWTPVSDQILCWLKKFFTRESDDNVIEPLVLRNLIKVPAGKTVTYGGLAEISGSSKASRAVGQAMRKNPLPLLVPCHRVVGSNGIGNYMSGEGNNIKSWLLHFENADVTFKSSKKQKM